MGMASILVMWPEPFEQTFIVQALSEEKFKECGRRMTDNDGRCTTEAYLVLSYKLTSEPLAQVS